MIFGMFVRLAFALALGFGCTRCVIAAADEPLRRRADLGASIAPPDAGRPATIVRFRPESVLEKAGFAAGDQIVSANGNALDDPIAFGAFLRSLRASDTVELAVRRGAGTLTRQLRAAPMQYEAIPGLDVVYGEATTDNGYRVRTDTARPAGVRGRLPVVVFIPWLSCDAVEQPFGPRSDGWAKMLRAVMLGTSVQFVRIEKPGVGDSDGPDCSAADLDDDMAAFRAGIRAALADPGADPKRFILFGGSVGGALAPLLAQEFHPRAIIATGGFTRTWYEHMLAIERERLTLSGRPPADVNAAMKAFAELYDLVLLQGLTPAAAIARKPELARVWYDAPAHQYGRPIRYYQQLQALDVEAAWDRVRVPTLVLWGDYDWIMGHDESERCVAILRAHDPALVTYVVRRRMNHHFDVFPDPVAAFNEENGEYDEGAAQAIVDWVGARLRAN
ncbi:MAG TPA: alpha/beta fold hydrolase [Casimicrobiaceae bacterium]|nr:alpha/beta fold hydrolase [Casimicrobiaceae bacterium]